MKYQATFNYNVQYSGIKSLRIDVPADVAPLLHNNTPGIHEKTIDPPPADLEKNMVAWSFSGEGELLGEGQINLTWEKKLDKLDVGKPVAAGCAAACASQCRSRLGADCAGQGRNARLRGGRGP